MVKRRYILALLFVLLMGLNITCVDPFNLGVTSADSNLVIEGLIHSDPGPYRIRIYRASDLVNPVPEENATVSVSDDQGNEFTFSESEPGVYLSSEVFQGEIGRTYTLDLQTSNGNAYSSTSEEMLSVTAQDSIYLRHAEKSVISDLGNEVTIEGFDILLDTKSGSSSPSYYRWDYRGVFALVTPDPCAFCPGLCFVMDQPVEFLKVFGTDQSNTPVTEVNMGFFIGGIEFETSYRIFIRQYSLTQRGFDFWKAVEDQRTNTGSIFDPPPGVIAGNVTNTSNPQENVLGFFEVSGVSERMLFISRSDIFELAIPFPNNFSACDPGPNDPPPPGFCGNCLAFPNSSVEFPEDIW